MNSKSATYTRLAPYCCGSAGNHIPLTHLCFVLTALLVLSLLVSVFAAVMMIMIPVGNVWALTEVYLQHVLLLPLSASLCCCLSPTLWFSPLHVSLQPLREPTLMCRVAGMWRKMMLTLGREENPASCDHSHGFRLCLVDLLLCSFTFSLSCFTVFFGLSISHVSYLFPGLLFILILTLTCQTTSEPSFFGQTLHWSWSSCSLPSFPVFLLPTAIVVFCILTIALLSFAVYRKQQIHSTGILHMFLYACCIFLYN